MSLICIHDQFRIKYDIYIEFGVISIYILNYGKVGIDVVRIQTVFMRYAKRGFKMAKCGMFSFCGFGKVIWK